MIKKHFINYFEIKKNRPAFPTDTKSPSWLLVRTIATYQTPISKNIPLN